VAKHRGRKGPEVVRHKRTMHPSDRWSAVVALLLLAAGFGLLGYLMLTIPGGGGLTP
jgi:hypothetical protein